MNKFALLTLGLLLSSRVLAECPKLDGDWDINLAPTAKVAIQNQILFSALRLSFTVSGRDVEVLSGIGFENPIDQSKAAISRSLDTINRGTISQSAKCRLLFKLTTTEKKVLVLGVDPTTQDNIPLSFNLKGDALAVLQGFSGSGVMKEDGKKFRVGFTMTPRN